MLVAFSENMDKQLHYKNMFFSGLIVGTSWKTSFVAVAILVHSLNQWAWWSHLLELKYEFFMSLKVFRPMPSLLKKFLKTNFVLSNAKRTSNHTRKAARWPTLVLGKELFRNGRNTQYCITLIQAYCGGSGALCVQIYFTRTFQTTTKCDNINHVWSHFYKLLVVLKYHRRLWANIFDTDICRSINIPKKAKYTTLM